MSSETYTVPAGTLSNCWKAIEREIVGIVAALGLPEQFARSRRGAKACVFTRGYLSLSFGDCDNSVETDNLSQ